MILIWEQFQQISENSRIFAWSSAQEIQRYCKIEEPEYSTDGERIRNTFLCK